MKLILWKAKNRGKLTRECLRSSSPNIGEEASAPVAEVWRCRTDFRRVVTTLLHPSRNLLHVMGKLIDSGIPVLPDEVDGPAAR